MKVVTFPMITSMRASTFYVIESISAVLHKEWGEGSRKG